MAAATSRAVSTAGPGRLRRPGGGAGGVGDAGPAVGEEAGRTGCRAPTDSRKGGAGHRGRDGPGPAGVGGAGRLWSCMRGCYVQAGRSGHR
jgi:hypothetical protein